ncbi:MAG: peptidoglycan recognition protein family protein [Micromonosporaceae bacterium]
MTTYLPRSVWTSTAASGATLWGISLRGVAVHWPGTTQDRIGDPGQEAIAERLRHYRSFHLSKGWQDIGYNLAIDQAGRVWMLRSTSWDGDMIGAHCASPGNPNANREYVGVLLLLGNHEPLSDAMINAFRGWYRDRFLPEWPGRSDVRGHGKVPGAQTECPGHYARAVMGELTTPPQGDDDMTIDELMNHTIATGQGTFKVATLLANAALLPRIWNDTHADLDEVALAAALAALLPTVDQAALEAALRTVLGSLDE